MKFIKYLEESINVILLIFMKKLLFFCL